MKLREQPKIPEKRSKGRPFIKSSQSHRYPPQTTYIIMFMQWNTKDGMDIALQCTNQLRIIHIIGKHIPHPSQEKNSSVQFIFVMTGRVTDVCTFNIPPTYRLPRQRNNTPAWRAKAAHVASSEHQAIGKWTKPPADCHISRLNTYSTAAESIFPCNLSSSSR